MSSLSIAPIKTKLFPERKMFPVSELNPGFQIISVYFVLRLDAAIPFRKPYLDDNGKWIFDNPDFFGDYVFSVAVGYPF